MPVNGPNGPQGQHKVTTQRVKSADGVHYFTKKTVHIGINEQKWVPNKINPSDYSSLNKIKKLYPGCSVETSKNNDGTVEYEITPKDWAETKTLITVKEDVKGSHIEIVDRQNGFFVSGRYEDGKLVRADKTPEQNDPYIAWD